MGPDLYEKYLALDTTGLKDFSKNVGADEEFVNTIPDNINLFPNTTKLSEEDKKLYSRSRHIYDADYK